jgi:hypothetical protein
MLSRCVSLRWRGSAGIAVVGLFLVIASSGCGSGIKKPDWPPGVEVSGSVKLDGQPVELAIVRYIPEAETSGPGATGMTDSLGEYSLTYRDPNGKIASGVIPGKYKVAISRMLKPDGTVWTPSPENNEGPMTTGAREQIPMKFSNPAQCTLRAVIGPKGGTFNFDVKTK